MKICYECGHFKNLEPGSVRADIWYNHLCMASPSERWVSPTTGKEETEKGQDYQYCRDINPDDACKKFRQI